jgi:hypothetical protein
LLYRPGQPIRLATNIDVAGDTESLQVEHSHIVIRPTGDVSSRSTRLDENPGAPWSIETPLEQLAAHD